MSELMHPFGCQIKDQIEHRLDWADVPPATVGVTVVDDVVTVTGHADSPADRERIIDAALTVHGLRAVVDHLDVGIDDELSDAAIAQGVQDPLRLQSQRAVAIVRGAVVTIRAEVDTDGQRREILDSVADLRAPAIVVDEIHVRPAPDPDAIRASIGESLVEGVGYEVGGLDITVEGHRVALAGSVRSLNERRAAERAAQRTAGVTAVDNLLQVLG